MLKKILFITLFIVLTTGFITSLEIGTYFNMGNMSFKETPLSSNTFPSNKLPWGVTILGSQNVGEGLQVDFGYQGDPILNNLAYGTFTYTGDFFSMGAGPLVGLFNTTETKTQPGISTNFRLELPGIAYVKFDLLSSIGYKMSALGDYNQNMSNITLGFYIPNAICTINMEEKNYSQIGAFTDSTDNVFREKQDSLLEYSFKTEIYKKNIPFKILIGLIYRTTSNNYIKEEITTTATDISSITTTVADKTLTQALNTILLQTKVDFSFTNWLTMVFDLKSSIFGFGSIENEVTDTNDILNFTETRFPDSYLFEASLGFRIDIDNLRNL